MADVLLNLCHALVAQASEPAPEATENPAKPKFEATPAGLLVAYVSILVMSVVPIYFGSFKSVIAQKATKESGEQAETMSTKDAMMFPVVASCALFGLYAVFKIFGKEYINMLLSFYFFMIGVWALTSALAPVIRSLISHSLICNDDYELTMIKTKYPDLPFFEFNFDHFDLIALGFSSLFGVWYLYKKHWIANNLFGLAFAHNGITLLHLNSVATGCILLSGLFFYDVFWVFGTDVMVTVAKSFEAPIKLIFPQDFIEKGFWGEHFAMLGLGDIVIPGIFIALLLRYDLSKGTGSRLYFIVSFAAYVLGLVLTVFVMTIFKHAQPALLYLVPMCVGCPLFVALIRGEIKQLFRYRDQPDMVIGDDDDEQDHSAAKNETTSTANGSKKQPGMSTRSKAKKTD